jgi:hypothetical protein
MEIADLEIPAWTAGLAVIVCSTILMILKQVLIYLDFDIAPYEGYFKPSARILLIVAIIRCADRFSSGAINFSQEDAAKVLESMGSERSNYPAPT